MTIAQQLRCTYAAIATHVRSNCNAHPQQLQRTRERAVFAPQEAPSCIAGSHVFHREREQMGERERRYGDLFVTLRCVAHRVRQILVAWY
jgi:hypothetical protein